jgi:hypothetical protein
LNAGFASHAFEDTNAQITYDETHTTTEDRYNLIGTVGNHILFIVYTVRGDVIRMISVRPATRREKERYYQTLRGTHNDLI